MNWAPSRYCYQHRFSETPEQDEYVEDAPAAARPLLDGLVFGFLDLTRPFTLTYTRLDADYYSGDGGESDASEEDDAGTESDAAEGAVAEQARRNRLPLLLSIGNYSLYQDGDMRTRETRRNYIYFANPHDLEPDEVADEYYDHDAGATYLGTPIADLDYDDFHEHTSVLGEDDARSVAGDLIEHMFEDGESLATFFDLQRGGSDVILA